MKKMGDLNWGGDTESVAELFQATEKVDIKREEFRAHIIPDTIPILILNDTISILNRYIEEAEIQLDKSRVQNIMRQTYQEACELI